MLLLGLACAACMGSDGPTTTEIELEVVDASAARIAEVIERRLEGVEGASAREKDATRVAVEVPEDRAHALVPVLVAPGKLEVYDLQGQLVPPSIDRQGVPVPTADRAALPKDAVVLRCGAEQPYCPGADEAVPTRTYYYAIRGAAKLTNADFARESIRQDFDARTNQPIVFLEFTARGARKFHDLTRELAQRGQLLANRSSISDEAAFQQLAIVLDGVLLSAPVIDFNESPEGFPGDNGAQITGMSVTETRNLAAVLRGGELPGRASVARGPTVEVED